MPDIKKLGQDADSLGTITLDVAKKMQSALPSITNSVQITLQSIQEFSKILHPLFLLLIKRLPIIN